MESHHRGIINSKTSEYWVTLDPQLGAESSAAAIAMPVPERLRLPGTRLSNLEPPEGVIGKTHPDTEEMALARYYKNMQG